MTILQIQLNFDWDILIVAISIHRKSLLHAIREEGLKN